MIQFEWLCAFCNIFSKYIFTESICDEGHFANEFFQSNGQVIHERPVKDMYDTLFKYINNEWINEQ